MGNSDGDPVSLLQIAADTQTDNWIIWAGPGSIFILILCSAFFAYAARYFAANSLALSGNASAKLEEKPVHVQAAAYATQLFLISAIISLSIFYGSYIWNFNGWYVAAFISFEIIIFICIWLALGKWFNGESNSAAKISLIALTGISAIFNFLGRPLEKMLNTKADEDEAIDEYGERVNIKDILVQNKNTPGVAEEKHILRGILNFSNIYVKQIMRPRTEVVAHDIKTPFNKLCRLINENRYSRVPIYDGSFDKIKGILYVKDLLPYLNNKVDFDWATLLREPYFVPMTKKIDILLQEFKRKKVHLAIVIDEYGGSAGIITLEDILEEIVGEIQDEFDEEEVNYSKLDKDNFVFDGKTPLTDVVRIMDLSSDAFDNERFDAETIGGFLIEMNGNIPTTGQKVENNNFRFTVEASDGRRVRRVKISRLQASPSA